MRCLSVCRRESVSVDQRPRRSEPAGFAKRFGTTTVNGRAAVALQQVPVEVERRVAIRRDDGPPTRRETPGRAAAAPVRCDARVLSDELGPRRQTEPLHCRRRARRVGEVRLHRVERRVRVQAVQLVRGRGRGCTAPSRRSRAPRRASSASGRPRTSASRAGCRGPTAGACPSRTGISERPSMHAARLSARRLDDRRREVDVRRRTASGAGRPGCPGPRMISGTRIDGS